MVNKNVARKEHSGFRQELSIQQNPDDPKIHWFPYGLQPYGSNYKDTLVRANEIHYNAGFMSLCVEAIVNYRKMLKSKIHRARVTHADVDYEGSITISPELLKLANIYPNEAVNVWNVTAGTRFETYAIRGEPGSCDVCVNGAAAHLVTPGDIIIIASFIQLADEYCLNHTPTVVFVDDTNQLKEIRSEVAACLHETA